MMKMKLNTLKMTEMVYKNNLEDDQLDYDENYAGDEEEDIMNQVFTTNTIEKNTEEKPMIDTKIKEEKKEQIKEDIISTKPKNKLSSLFDDKPSI